MKPIRRAQPAPPEAVRSAAVPEAAPVPEVLPAVSRLFNELAARDISYCLWKGRGELEDSLRGEEDFDLLIHRRDAPAFTRALAECGFEPVLDPTKTPHPSMVQYIGMDPDTHRFVQIDAYHRVITGTKFVKAWHFPLENALLASRRHDRNIRLPDADAELVVMVLRKIIKSGSLMDRLALPEHYTPPAIRRDLERVLRDADEARAADLVREHLPAVDPSLWADCLEALRTGATPWRRFVLRTRLLRQLRSYRCVGSITTWWHRLRVVARRIARGRGARRGTKRMTTGGAVVALVGPEATGKSTLVRELGGWLGKTFRVRTAHLGKPPSSWLTAIPNLALPLMRRAFRRHRTDRLPDAHDGEPVRPSPLFAARCLMVAFDRYVTARTLHAQAGRGDLVLCDRYPSPQVGAMDSARLRLDGARGWRAWAARLEQELYRKIPPPDLVLELSAPPDVAVRRNRERDKPTKESDEQVLRRHAAGQVPTFPAVTLPLQTDDSLDRTLARAKGAVWREL